jgi:hypothetical protein
LAAFVRSPELLVREPEWACRAIALGVSHDGRWAICLPVQCGPGFAGTDVPKNLEVVLRKRHTFT